MAEEKSIAESLLEEATKIREALMKILKSGVPKEVVVLMIQRKTRIGITKIRQVLDALIESLNELSKPMG